MAAAKVLVLLLLLVVCSACGSRRQQVASISMAQRQQWQLSVSDTLCQVLRFHLTDVTLEWVPDSGHAEPQGPCVALRLHAAEGEGVWEQQSHKAVTVEEECADTVAQRQEMVVEQGVGSSAPRARGRWWLWVVVVLVVALAALGYYAWRRWLRR